MIAGRLHWKPAHAALKGRQNLAAFDFVPGSLTLTEAGSKRRASLHVVAGEAGLLAMDPGGIDVLTADLAGFRGALIRENRTLKRALTDPRVVGGVGNAYSDEILHAARLSSLGLTGKLTGEEWDRLFAATRGTLELWVGRLSAEVRGSRRRSRRFAKAWRFMGATEKRAGGVAAALNGRRLMRHNRRGSVRGWRT